jgi:HEAT repeat protein
MRAESHQQISDFLATIRSSIENDDQYGQQLLKMTYQEFTADTRNILHAVKALREAVIALGGKPENARTWAIQAYRWLETGRPVESKYAAYEVDPRAGPAMDAVIEWIKMLPEPLRRPTPPYEPPPKTPPPNPFKSPSPFGVRPSPFARPVAPPPTFETLPFYVASCFDALDVVPDTPRKPSNFGGNSPFAPPKPILTGELPTDLWGLLEAWHKVKGTRNTDEITKVLAALGRLDDMRALDHIYNIQRTSEADLPLLDIFTKIGGNVGAAGLVAMLPITEKLRVNWLTSLVNVARGGHRGDRPINEQTIDTLWKIAVAESAPNVIFCAPAIKLLSATHRRESVPILWEHARSEDAKRRQTAIYALAEIDPGEEGLEALLEAFVNSLDLPAGPPFPFGSQPDPILIGIPFERMAAVIKGRKHTLRASAVKLIGYLDDPRVRPLLIHQLDSQIEKVRELALAHLRRLKATEAADAIARLMDRDPVLQRRAADVLHSWDDTRAVPVLLKAMVTDDGNKTEDIIKRLGRLNHPAFAEWITGIIKEFEGRGADGVDPLIDVISALADVESPLLPGILLNLTRSPADRVRQIAALGLGIVDNGKSGEELVAMLRDRAPVVAYYAAHSIRKADVGRDLLGDRSKVKRLLGIKILWGNRSVDGLIAAAHDKSAAVKTAAVWSLTNLLTNTSPFGAIPPNVDKDVIAAALMDIVEKEDYVNEWGFNPAVLAWIAVARSGRMNAPKEEKK